MNRPVISVACFLVRALCRWCELRLTAIILAAALGLASLSAAAEPNDALNRTDRVASFMASLVDRPPELRMFLQRMPKGGDLHNHLDGTVYAEDFIKWAAEDGMCVDRATHALIAGPCDQHSVPARGLASRNPKRYADTVDALSMRDFVPGDGADSGHDRFFSTFGKFMSVGAHHRAGMLVAALNRAAANHLSYVEYMSDPSMIGPMSDLGLGSHWQSDDLGADLARIETAVSKRVPEARQEFRQADRQAAERMHCHSEQAASGCTVAYRYIFYVNRTAAPPVVFAQMALGFAMAQADPQVVGINIVAPEDNPVALADYRQHMAMFSFFAKRYPDVRISLHAGELTLGLVPPRDLRFHIAAAVAAGASRIGHGVDIAYEDNAQALLSRMARRRIAVEINLSSNAIILGVSGSAHPLALYQRAGVPIVLSTDDAGVARGDISHEYLRAVRDQHLDYRALKQAARNSLTYAFLAGRSLWADADHASPVTACATAWHRARLTAGCRRYLASSPKARLQWRLEQQFRVFESSVIAQLSSHAAQ